MQAVTHAKQHPHPKRGAWKKKRKQKRVSDLVSKQFSYGYVSKVVRAICR